MIWFYVEAKAFELSEPEGGFVLRLVERRHGFSRVMLLGKLCVVWLKSTVKALVPNPKVTVYQII